jgi:predicted transcriptional regulator
MPRRTAPPTTETVERRQIGVRIDTAVWTQLKILALKQRKDAFEVLEQAIKEYLERHGGD